MAKAITDIALGLAALLSIVIALHHAEWQISGQHLLLLLWVVLPYILCRIASIGLLRSQNPALRNVSIIFAVAVLLFSAVSYGGLYFGTASSTSSLAFVSVPLYILIGALIVFVPAYLMLSRAGH